MAWNADRPGITISIMPQFHRIQQDELLGSLTHYYQQYRHLNGQGGSKEDFEQCYSMLLAIIEELNYRNKFWSLENNPDTPVLN
jgi:hypothetical protein